MTDAEWDKLEAKVRETWIGTIVSIPIKATSTRKLRTKWSVESAVDTVATYLPDAVTEIAIIQEARRAEEAARVAEKASHTRDLLDDLLDASFEVDRVLEYSKAAKFDRRCMTPEERKWYQTAFGRLADVHRAIRSHPALPTQAKVEFACLRPTCGARISTMSKDPTDESRACQCGVKYSAEFIIDWMNRDPSVEVQITIEGNYVNIQRCSNRADEDLKLAL